MKNNHVSNFISFACWKTTIGRDINIVQIRRGIFINVFLLVFNNSHTTKVTTISERIPQTLFKKKAWVLDQNINQIQVKVCQENIDHKKLKSHALASSLGIFI